MREVITHADAWQAGAHHRAALRLGFMYGRSSLSFMVALLSRLVMYSSFSFTTCTDTMHQSIPEMGCLQGLHTPAMLFRASTESMQKGLCIFVLQLAHLLKHAIPALQASLLLRHLSQPRAQLCHLQGAPLCISLMSDSFTHDSCEGQGTQGNACAG